MKVKIFKYVTFQIISLGLLLLHIYIKTILPYPLDHINVIILVFLWINILNLSSFFYSSMFVALFLLELFTSAPFGLNAAGIIVSYFIIQWFIHEIFTYHSWYIIGILTLISFVSYRIIWYIGATFFIFLTNNQLIISQEMFKDWVFEALCSTVVMFIAYVLVASFTPYFKPHYIKKRQKIFYE